VLTIGDRLPDSTVFRNPGEPVRMSDLVEGGPALLLFYLFDWSST
jgi:peroxiredoxin